MARRRHHARENPSTRTLYVVGGLAALAVGGIALYLYNKSKSTPQLPASTPTTPTPATPAAPQGPQTYSFSTNDSGGHVTLHPGDSVSFAFPNQPSAATTAGGDWFWTSAPNLGYKGRTVTTQGSQLVETDTFVYGGGGASQMDVVAQLLASNGPATANAGPTPPVAYPNPTASTFKFTIVTTG